MEKLKNRLELYELFERERRTGYAVEVGVKEGWNAKNILDRYKGHLFLVDIWENREDFKHAFDLLFEYSGRVSFLQMSSENAAWFLKDYEFDFVYIDAGHEYDEVSEDIDLWLSKPSLQTGYLAGHDYSPEFPGVIKAVDECKRWYDVHITYGDIYEGVAYESWYFKVGN
jgi:hypothetical protein